MEKLERMLAQWIEHQHQYASPLSTLLIQAKLLTEFFKHIVVDADANRERSAEVSKQLRVLGLVTKNCKFTIHWLCNSAGPARLCCTLTSILSVIRLNYVHLL
jgi:hypothetical protein